MLLTGRALDRWGLRCPLPPVVVALGGAGLAAAITADRLVSLCAGFASAGIASGVVDVTRNSVGGRAAQGSGRSILTRAGVVFSTAVVVSSLATGVRSR
jgi:hypothetical protein